MAGMVLSAPLVSAAVRVRRDLRQLRATQTDGGTPADDGAVPSSTAGVAVSVPQRT
jgi:hypothetical protein